ncbi:UPF0104 family protein [Agrobacterium sp. a22-2]|uniref:lysylphosphatidylglycerol synthase domain-containing protein n=1 Tax=Agrobacterium sp. a22-2 TaxID=2283840 RepID=UPI001445DA84|nr:lysylphosphatidylglycerol synthase domain-containing protein [Agrobacterium sp. a22-2]NKN38702.1 UPF0104 family protein [Agrobacterium sp. a22-2]
MTKTILLRIVIVIAICGALFLAYRTLNQYSLDDITSSIAQIPKASFLLALGFAALSYLCLTGFDYLALHYAGKPLAYPKAALASFIGLSIGHNIGVAALSSGAVRYRFYTRWGLSAEEIAKVILFCGLTVGIGLITLAGLCLLILPESAAKVGGMDPVTARLVGGLCLAAIALYLMAAAIIRGSVTIIKWPFTLPSLPIAAGQVVIGTANFACVAACLHQLLNASAGYMETTTAYVVGNLTALVSHVPGGLGVLEATITYLMGGAASIGALIAFRVVYFFIPLPIGLILLVISELTLASPSAEPASSEAG